MRPAEQAPSVTVDSLGKEYALGRSSVRALDSVSIHAAPSEFVTIVGPSGCGKSTLLRIVAGLEEPDEGTVLVGDAFQSDRLGHCGYMPQRDMLLPWRTVLDNAVLPLEYRGVPRALARDEAAGVLASFGLQGFEDAWPGTLSGGMRQRVALARTALTRCRVLLLDEPFGALDALTRLEMQTWLLDVWDRLATTVILVTHDIDEAVYLSDRVYVMSARPGSIVAEIPITLPRPRAEEMVATADFARHKGAVLEAIRATRTDGAGRMERGVRP